MTQSHCATRAWASFILLRLLRYKEYTSQYQRHNTFACNSQHQTNVLPCHRAHLHLDFQLLKHQVKHKTAQGHHIQARRGGPKSVKPAGPRDQRRKAFNVTCYLCFLLRIRALSSLSINHRSSRKGASPPDPGAREQFFDLPNFAPPAQGLSLVHVKVLDPRPHLIAPDGLPLIDQIHR